MEKDQMISLLHATEYKVEDLSVLDEMIEKYPYFGLPRFLRLKIQHELSMEISRKELEETVVYSSDRKYLYMWMRGELVRKTVSSLVSSEIEFIEEEESALVTDSFELINEFASDEEMAVSSNENELDDPELDEAVPVPMIHPTMDEEAVGEEEESVQKLEEEGVIRDDIQEEELREEGEAGLREHLESEDPSEALQYPVADIGHLLIEKQKELEEKSSEKELNLIEQFLQNEPDSIKAEEGPIVQGDISEKSVEEDDSFITDTLAKIYVKQGLHAKAVYAYERLSLKYPEKSAYFAAQIEKIKSISNL